ncbi:hypothetical protein LTR62_001213 [Meristemomyces frigidus]|uniref:Uncharacterized protein n=1 Tax=Meristemomyces frigidus TaxID=1508187 RepID=A0AAN7YIE3_9PEZI|nr:hypothetical protein LTR62_001213 [Meristemomyces frigidus]
MSYATGAESSSQLVESIATTLSARATSSSIVASGATPSSTSMVITTSSSSYSAVLPSTASVTSRVAISPITSTVPIPTVSEASNAVSPTQSIPSSVPTGTLTMSLQSHRPAVASALSTVARHESTSRQVIIGGLCGSIASLLVLGLLIFFILRRRRKRKDDETGITELMDEKDSRPAFMRQWTVMTTKSPPKQDPHDPQMLSPVTVDEEHHIIRMSTKHWARPYAHGTGEGYRESMVPGALRVVNPDISRPSTPTLSSLTESPRKFMSRQRLALATVLLTVGGSSIGRSRAGSRADQVQTSGGQDVIVDAALSRECIAPTAIAPSLQSSRSASSLQVLHHHQPLDDPFLTPPEERNESNLRLSPPRRPGLAPLQSTPAAGLAQKTLSNILHPFRSKSTLAVEQQRRLSGRSSIGTFL